MTKCDRGRGLTQGYVTLKSHHLHIPLKAFILDFHVKQNDCSLNPKRQYCQQVTSRPYENIIVFCSVYRNCGNMAFDKRNEKPTNCGTKGTDVFPNFLGGKL